MRTTGFDAVLSHAPPRRILLRSGEAGISGAVVLSTPRERRLTILAQLAAAWCLFATVELTLNAVVRGSALYSADLPFHGRLGALCYDLLALTVTLLASGLASMLLEHLTKRGYGTYCSMARLARGLRLVLICLGVLTYATSWAMYLLAGRFLDHEAVAFWMTQPVQVFYWADSRHTISVLASAFIVSVVVGVWLPRQISRSPIADRRRLLQIVSAVATVSLAVALVAELVENRGLSPLAPPPVYPGVRDSSTGPFAHAVADVRKAFWSGPAVTASTNMASAVRPPIVTMRDYLGSVNSERVNRWNVVIIVVESLRADQLRAYGSPRSVMPAVDALATAGRVFSDAYTQASHSSYASPVPLSSQYPLRSRTIHTYPKNPTYPRVLIYDVLKPLGYRTGVFSSQNEHWEGMINYLETGNIDRFFHPEVFDGRTYTMAGDIGFAGWVRNTRHAGSVDDQFTMNEAIQWIRSRRDSPFFLSLNLQNSHIPYVVPEGVPRKFGPAKPDFPLTFMGFPRDKVNVVKDLYADSLAYVDAQIGRLVEELQREGRLNQTVIVVTGDHGQAFYEHGVAAHANSLFNEVVRVPLVIKAPGLQPGVDNRPAQHVDVAPTVFQLLGLPAHPSFQGISLLAPGHDDRRSVYFVVQTPLAHQCGIVRNGYKLIYDEDRRRHLLYDLVHDPGETRNLAPSDSRLVKDLGERLYSWREAQISYYEDRNRQAREYPPVLED